MGSCAVAYVDIHGIRHSVEIDSVNSVYEAAAIAISKFKKHDCAPGSQAKLEVEIRDTITHTVTVAKVNLWLNSTARSPKEMVMKDRLRELIAGN